MIILLLLFAPVLLFLFVIYQMIKAVLVFLTALVLVIVDKR